MKGTFTKALSIALLFSLSPVVASSAATNSVATVATEVAPSMMSKAWEGAKSYAAVPFVALGKGARWAGNGIHALGERAGINPYVASAKDRVVNGAKAAKDAVVSFAKERPYLAAGIAAGTVAAGYGLYRLRKSKNNALRAALVSLDAEVKDVAQNCVASNLVLLLSQKPEFKRLSSSNFQKLEKALVNFDYTINVTVKGKAKAEAQSVRAAAYQVVSLVIEDVIKSSVGIEQPASPKRWYQFWRSADEVTQPVAETSAAASSVVTAPSTTTTTTTTRTTFTQTSTPAVSRQTQEQIDRDFACALYLQENGVMPGQRPAARTVARPTRVSAAVKLPFSADELERARQAEVNLYARRAQANQVN